MQTLTFVGRYTTKKDGSALVSSQGKPYTSVRIKTQEHGDKFISGFGNAENAHWKAGDTVDIEVVQKGDYLNFTMPKKEEKMAASAAELKNLLEFGVIGRLDRLEALLHKIVKLVQNVPTEDGPNPEDLPF